MITFKGCFSDGTLQREKAPRSVNWCLLQTCPHVPPAHASVHLSIHPPLKPYFLTFLQLPMHVLYRPPSQRELSPKCYHRKVFTRGIHPVAWPTGFLNLRTGVHLPNPTPTFHTPPPSVLGPSSLLIPTVPVSSLLPDLAGTIFPYLMHCLLPSALRGSDKNHTIS